MLISDEQHQIAVYKSQGKNIIVDACAGSGKSTTIIHLALENPDAKFLVITYNAMLRLEFKEKLVKDKITNVEVHTFHSLAVRYFLPSANTDTGLRKILYKQLPLTIPDTLSLSYDVVALDECQDMSFLYFQFIVYFIKHTRDPIQLIILGDYKQGLYEFKGSDTRFLTKAKEIWSDFPHLLTQEFVHCSLKTSYRVTNQIAAFVNHVMLGEERLFACREGARVHYIRYPMFNIERIIIYKIKELLASGNYVPSDFFVLGASVKGNNSNIRRIENALTEAGIPCMVPMLEMEQMDDRVIHGKVVFSTFHSVKGRQRKVVLIVGFDNSYLNFFARDLPKDECPNTLYVGATRATEQLFLLERADHANDRPLTFLNMEHYEMNTQSYIKFQGIPKNTKNLPLLDTKNANNDNSLETEKQMRHNVTPTDLTRFLPEILIEEITPVLDRIFVKNNVVNNNSTVNTNITDLSIEIPPLIETQMGFFEDVSDINGIAIPCMYYDIIQNGYNQDQYNTSKNILYDIIANTIDNFKSKDHKYLRAIFDDLQPCCQTTADYLYMANVYLAVKEGLYFRLKQITKEEANWIPNEIREQCVQRMTTVIGNRSTESNPPQFEVNIIAQAHDLAHAKIDAILAPFFAQDIYRFTARIDILTDSTLWELKCTSSINMEHQIQVVIYAWLAQCVGILQPVKILNIKTGDIWELCATFEELTELVVKILKSKYEKPVVLSTEEFVEMCRKEIV